MSPVASLKEELLLAKRKRERGTDVIEWRLKDVAVRRGMCRGEVKGAILV